MDGIECGSSTTEGRFSGFARYVECASMTKIAMLLWHSQRNPGMSLSE
ncbi:hypothetical protein [Actibacterium sp.]|jgi:hypothetical protein|nr:hypothetical protein [Actibacterium sp.]